MNTDGLHFMAAAGELLRRSALLCNSRVTAPAGGARVVAAWPDADSCVASILWSTADGRLGGFSTGESELGLPGWDEDSVVPVALDVGEPLDRSRYAKDLRTGVWWGIGSSRDALDRFDISGFEYSCRVIETFICDEWVSAVATFSLLGVWPTSRKLEVAVLDNRSHAVEYFEFDQSVRFDDFLSATGGVSHRNCSDGAG